MIRSRLSSTLSLFALALAAQAEKADREKPINFSGDDGTFNYETKTGNLSGRVVITQGTISIRADKITFKQNPDNSLAATAIGNPVSFRQKRDGTDEYYEGFAQRIEYDGARELVELFDRALLKRGQDEIRSNYVSYNASTEVFKAEGRPDAPAAVEGPGARVRGVFQPKDGESPAKPADKSPDKGKDAKAAKAPPPKTPLGLQPDRELKSN
jgi:lipopolysaccharide export system protein LptA